MEALGRLYDISTGVAPVDFAAGASTGKRVSLKNCDSISFVVFLSAAASGVETPVFTLQQHTAATGGTTSNLVTCDHWYTKIATALAGSETWVRVNQTASQTITLSDTVTPSFPNTTPITGVAQKQAIVVIPLDGASLSDGYAYVSLNVNDPGTVARVSGVLYLLHDLDVQRAPYNLAAPLS